MELHVEGVMQNGVIVLDDAGAIPEGARVRITAITPEKPQTFGERMAKFCGAIKDAPPDLAAQHEHYRLGTPKR